MLLFLRSVLHDLGALQLLSEAAEFFSLHAEDELFFSPPPPGRRI